MRDPAEEGLREARRGEPARDPGRAGGEPHVDVTAPDYFLSTVPIPLAERGYYVFPVNLVKRVLEDDGLSDAVLVHSADPKRLAALFGADAVLYVTIERWDASTSSSRRT